MSRWRTEPTRRTERKWNKKGTACKVYFEYKYCVSLKKLWNSTCQATIIPLCLRTYLDLTIKKSSFHCMVIHNSILNKFLIIAWMGITQRWAPLRKLYSDVPVRKINGSSKCSRKCPTFRNCWQHKWHLWINHRYQKGDSRQKDSPIFLRVTVTHAILLVLIHEFQTLLIYPQTSPYGGKTKWLRP